MFMTRFLFLTNTAVQVLAFFTFTFLPRCSAASPHTPSIQMMVRFVQWKRDLAQLMTALALHLA
jgi:hypothetical protein